MRNTLVFSIAAYLFLASHGCMAQTMAPARVGIDPNTFIVGHPASPKWRLTHANAEHPAVLNAAKARSAAINPDTFIVQPPASVTWLAHGDAPQQTAMATPR